jgi:prepilin-type N-terminal cleavage/methylation domain-containing protein
MRRTGFTLIELLTVIAVIALLAGLLLPALSRAKARATAMTCLNHQRQLAFAWMLYAGDAADVLPHNYGEADTRRTIAEQAFYNWANNVMNWELDGLNTNAAVLAAGGLGPYCGGNAVVFRCPADRALSDLQQRAGWSARTRSISMNAMVGGCRGVHHPRQQRE